MKNKIIVTKNEKILLKFLKKHKKAWKNGEFFFIELPSDPVLATKILKSIENKFGYNLNCCWDSKECKTK